jgi:hypothetical protein
MARANLKHLIEDAELRVQRGRRNVDHQRGIVSALERDGHDATKAKALLKLFENALAIHVADRGRLIKELEKIPKAASR